ncbi:MAG: peroxide stress protein YaaA [Alphaproteobacteria bacterium]|jgi:uncharacterized protein|nr:peroxide stress protein YaaA [Porticoccaceae bacterium]MDP4785315.1 peroxide stress protein YaaA [Alphaproteobacteria bacterium]
MLVVISPAKKLNMQPFEDIVPTQPIFGDEANELADVMQNLSLDKLQSLMGISENLAKLNADRFAHFGSQDKKPAVLAFAGDTYLGLEAATLEPDEMAWAQNHLRVLSGLYGVLRPLDAIEPYRLEMGSRLATKRGKSLYHYWGTKIAEALNAQAAATGSDLLLNCASKEYFGAVDLASLALPVVTPIFLENKNGKAKIVSFYAKKARGAMARFVVQNRLKIKDDLKGFAAGGYCYQPDQSDADHLVFEREAPV